MADPRLISDFNDPVLAAENKRKYRSFDHQNLHAPFYAALRAVLTAPNADGKETRVLDVGSGTGENASLIADLGASVVAVEPAREMRRLGQDLYARQNIQLVDDALPSLTCVRAIATGEKRFDAVLVSATLQYVPPDDLKDALTTIATISKPGAIIRITYPTPPSRTDQFAIPPEQFRKAVDEANATLPASMHLRIIAQGSVPAADGRKALTGEPLRFVEFTMTVDRQGASAKRREFPPLAAANSR